MSPSQIELEDARTRDLSEGERSFFHRFPFVHGFGTPTSWHGALIPIHDYILGMSQLSLQTNDLILDLGCGAGWVSEFAALQGMRAVGVDVSEGTLVIARQRTEEKGLRDRTDFVRGDSHRLPFRDGSFQAVLCVGSLHHFEEMGLAIQEIARVLRHDGEAALMEPGRGHSQTAESKKAVEMHGVLEQDVLPEDVHRWAQEAGLAEFYVIPHYFAFPAMRWTWAQWLEHRACAAARRPDQGASRLRKLIRLVRSWWQAWRRVRVSGHGPYPAEYLFNLNWDQWMNDHGCLLLRKSTTQRTRGSFWAEELHAVIQPLEVRLQGDQLLVRLRLENTGKAVWLARTPGEHGQVKVGLQLLQPETGEICDLDYLRIKLPRDVPPGELLEIEETLALPEGDLPRRLRLDLVSEQVRWFDVRTPSGNRVEVNLGGRHSANTVERAAR